MRLSRTAAAAVLAAVLVGGLVAGWIATGWPSVRAEADAIRRAPRERAAGEVARLASALSARLDGLRAAEAERPYYQYSNLYHDPRGASQGLSVVPSPLATEPDDPLVRTYFQIDAASRLTIPTVNEELPQLSEPGGLADNRKLLTSLRTAVSDLGGGAVASAKRPQRPRQYAEKKQAMNEVASQEPQVQALDPSAYMQNAAPNTVYQQVQKKAPIGLASKGNASPVEVVTNPLAWRTAKIDGTPHLVATRTVRTPDGALVQGFVIDRAAASDWLDERATGARLVASPDDGRGVSAPVEASGGNWQVSIDPSAELVAAAGVADASERAFWRRLVPIALAAAACALVIVVMVARADRLARQRSRFAAAAAHELRTPLAGLQLYGDMLADGLGDPDRARDYARRVADEAARLGRVVANVLGFTQLERGALAVELASGDAADAARRAVDRMRPALEHAGVDLELALPDSLQARFDDDAVQRILQNLLDNAEKYTRDRPSRRVRVSARRAGDSAAIEIADDGPGVPRRAQATLFDAFARGVPDDGPAGLGLGLALSHALARRQGGDLTYADAEGGGAAFTLRLPA